MRTFFRFIRLAAELFIGFIILGLLVFALTVRITPPEVAELPIPSVEQVGPDHFVSGANWLRKDENDIWVVYIEGEAYERGLAYGALCEKLIRDQEEIFVGQIKTMIPSDFFLGFLKYFVAWFNKDMDEYVPLEYRKEIYGVSRSFSDDFNFVAPKYHRVLNYHAAHDIGHALQDLAIVGCTSFGATNSFSSDSTLIVGRNFDFYMGPEFSRQRLVTVCRPDSGYGYVSYSWAGLMGVVSGMNEAGLTVTINAAKSDLPGGAKDPISLLAREVLQYAATIEEAEAICARREVFVSESLLIGSSKDNRAAIIEKSTQKMGVFESTNDLVVCSNHYQSDAFADDEANVTNIHMSDSRYRYQLMNSLLLHNLPLTPEKATAILSETDGMKGEDIGLGNAKSINQLIGHHSVIFKPEQQHFWLSVYPNQIAGMYAYDFQHLLHLSALDTSSVGVDSLNIPPRSLYHSRRYTEFLRHLEIKEQIAGYLYFGKSFELTEELRQEFVRTNANSYATYMILGQYYQKSEDCSLATQYYLESLKHEVLSRAESEKIESLIHECEEQSH
ncbi:MAG: peptidase C45 [Flavobacteriales bacterium]|nr:peptidase C45 [Flavobacteriales bacterium]